MKKIILCAICAICGFTTANAQKFGHVNAQEIMQALPEISKMQSEMKSLQEMYKTDAESSEAEIKKKAEALEKEQATLPDNVKQRRQQEVQDMIQRYQQSLQDNEQALQKKYNELMEPIQKKVLDAINAVGQAGGYVYIMQTGSALYISSTLSEDVTAKVKAKLGLK